MNFKEHLLVLLMEESAEVSKDASKSLRFGLEDRWFLGGRTESNQERLVNELNDLMGTITMLVEHGIIPENWLDPSKGLAKREKVIKFMLYAQSVGALHEPVNYEQKRSEANQSL